MPSIPPILLPTASPSGCIYSSSGTKTQVMNYILIHFSSVCRWWWQSWGGVNRICDGNQEDMIKGCTHNTLLCTVLEDLTHGRRVESEWTGGKGMGTGAVLTWISKEIWWSRLVWLKDLGQWDGSVQKGRWKQRVDLCVWGKGDRTKPLRHLRLAFFSY